jgi:DNA-directed RNA polymerase specialized sigma24 family protein
LHLFYFGGIVPDMDTRTAPANPAYQAMIEEGRRRRKEALALKGTGKTDAEIGVLLGVSRERARQMVHKARKEQEAAK